MVDGWAGGAAGAVVVPADCKVLHGVGAVGHGMARRGTSEAWLFARGALGLS